MLIFSLLAFAFGTIVGSFLNAVIYRLGREKSAFEGRSYCPNCKHTLSWRDLVPIFSFLVLSGRCRYCRKAISWQYPLVEIATGILFLIVVFFNFPNLLAIGYLLVIVSLLVVIFVYDLLHYIIPDNVVYPAIAFSTAWVILNVVFGTYTIGQGLDYLYSALGAAGFFLLIVLVSKGKWMGVGDIKLAFFMGLVLSLPGILVALFFAFFSGAIIGLGLIMAGKRGLKSEIPFGPFLVSGTFFALFFGEKIANWYLNFLAY